MKKFFDIKEIEEVYTKIKDYIETTPLKYAQHLSNATNKQVWLKLENFQKTGSFKIRGALNKIINLSDQDKQNGLIAASAGNHAQGVALSASIMGIESTIVMPVTAPISKIQATKNYGANVVLHGNYFDDSLKKAKELAEKNNLTLVHAFGDIDVIKGQSTIAYELINQLKDFNVCLVPIGGGGIMSGISHFLKQYNPNIRIIGVEAENVNSYQQARQINAPIAIKGKPSIADGIAVKEVSPLTFEILNENVDEVVTVSENEIAQAMLFLLEKCKIVTEGSGAVTTAALLFDKIKNIDSKDKIIGIVTGGNVDITLIDNIINYALIKNHRRIVISINILNNNKDLQTLLGIIEECKAKLFKIQSTKRKNNLSLDKTNVKLVIDISDFEQEKQIKDKIKEHNFEIID